MGVRVEGYTVGGETRHINSAFFTFRLLDKTVALPQLLLETKVCMHHNVYIHVAPCTECVYYLLHTMYSFTLDSEREGS